MANIDDLYDMSDDDLEAAFKAAKNELSTSNEGGDTDVEEYDANVDDVNVDEGTDENEDLEVDGDDQTSDTDETEQPENQDSDTGEDGQASSTTDETSDDASDNTDKPEEDQTVAAKPSTVRKFKANGKEYELTQDEIDAQFPKLFGQAMDYTKKMQTIAPWRKTIDAIESAKLNHQDINLMIDALKGDKGAIAEVLKRTSTDALELNPDENSYTPKDYGRDNQTLALQDVLDSIKTDQEYATTSKILSTDWDDASWKVLSGDPEKIRLLHIDVKSGIFAQVQPIAEKRKVFDGNRQSDLDYYMAAAREFYEKRANIETQQREVATQTAQADAEAVIQARMAKVKVQEEQRKVAQKNSQVRKSAATSGASVGKPQIIDYLEDSDEAFEEWYKRINS